MQPDATDVKSVKLAGCDRRAPLAGAAVDVLALGDRLFHDNRGYWQLYPHRRETPNESSMNARYSRPLYERGRLFPGADQWHSTMERIRRFSAS